MWQRRVLVALATLLVPMVPSLAQEPPACSQASAIDVPDLGSKVKRLEAENDAIKRELSKLRQELAELRAQLLPAPTKAASMAAIYKAMKLTALSAPGDPFQIGGKVKVRFGLKNTLDRELLVPVDKTMFARPMQMVGVRNTWIERLGKDADIPVIPRRIVRQGPRYGAGGIVLFVSGNVPGSHTIAMETVIDTTGYPPGRYKYTVEYQDLDNKVLQSESVEFDLAAPAPG